MVLLSRVTVEVLLLLLMVVMVVVVGELGRSWYERTGS